MKTLDESKEVQWQTAGIIGGAVILFATGLADDLWNLSWKLRLGIQTIVAFGVTQCGVQATVFVAQPWIRIDTRDKIQQINEMISHAPVQSFTLYNRSAPSPVIRVER